ncbi:MAG: DinB family protein [Acidobacteriia bacterium]|nr:DinB family protein [Terriglobia bacterium]
MPATPEFAAAYCQMMLDGLAGEVETTKRVLAAVPEGTCDSYRPDPHARNGRELAWHIANTDIQFLDGIADLKFSMSTPEGADKPKTIAEIVAWYDRNFKRAADRVRALSPEQLMTPIDFFGVFNLPAAFYLGFLNNHMIHHRGELATYLRPMGSKVPSIYGGSYDEPWQPADAETTAA